MRVAIRALGRVIGQTLRGDGQSLIQMGARGSCMNCTTRVECSSMIRKQRDMRGGDPRARSRHRADIEGASDGQSLIRRGARGSCMVMVQEDVYTCTCLQICWRVQLSLQRTWHARERATPLRSHHPCDRTRTGIAAGDNACAMVGGAISPSSYHAVNDKVDSEGIRTPAGRAQWISSPSP